jgi:hypothetical protein
MRFEVLAAASMKMTVFWVVAPCSLVEVYRRFRGASCFHHQGDPVVNPFSRIQVVRKSSIINPPIIAQ